MPPNSESDAADENTQLLRHTSHPSISTVNDREHSTSKPQWKRNVVLLLGVFLVNSDNAILLANFRRIASEFGQLESASWIINSYILGLLLIQPMYGKLSDIYGRKPVLVLAYSCQCLGSLLAGIGSSFGGVLTGRALAGIGNAGITVLVSTIIVDLVPKDEVAVWRSYVYAVNQVGRAAGPSIGGIVSDRANWRWALLYPFPLLLVSLIIIVRTTSLPNSVQKDADLPADKNSTWMKLREIDFLGCGTLGVANCSLLLFLDRLQTNLHVGQDVLGSIYLATWLVFLAAFTITEGYWAEQPILPLRLLVTRDVFSSYSIQFLQTAAQVTLYTSIPLYFRITINENSTITAFRLLIISVGTIVGGLISGVFIKRTGRYRLLTCISLFLSSLSYLAIYLRWRGHTSWLETLYAFVAGVGFGVSLSSAFIALTANLQPDQVATATSGFYLSLNLGSVVGISASSLLVTSMTRKSLHRSLQGNPDASEIIRRVTSSLDNIDSLHGKTLQLVLKAYTNSIIYAWLVALVCGGLAFVAGFIMTEGRAPASPAKESDERARGTC